MGVSRRTYLTGIGATTLAGLAGCTGGPGGSSDVNVGMVYATGGLGDGSFNDQAQQGLEAAGEHYESGEE